MRTSLYDHEYALSQGITIRSDGPITFIHQQLAGDRKPRTHLLVGKTAHQEVIDALVTIYAAMPAEEDQ